MVFQNDVWLISLLGMGLITLGFLYVITQAGKPADAAQADRSHRTFNVVRHWLFGALLVLFAVVSYSTLRPFPVPPQHTPLMATQVVNVTARQWSWELSTARVEAGVPVEFRVSSADVNHGFALYAPNGRIVIQTQAMPGYTNKLLYTFEQPGAYRIRCLEYCGIAHHFMESNIDVFAAAGAAAASKGK